jgi:ribonucleotide reductase alpha subunit
MIEQNDALAMLRDEDQLASVLAKEFTLEKLYNIMKFAQGVVDIRKADSAELDAFFLNMFTWAGVYVRRAQIFKDTEGRNTRLPDSVFTRVKLFLRVPEFNHITVDMMPVAEPKPLVARGTGKKRTNARQSIQESHPGFYVLTRSNTGTHSFLRALELFWLFTQLMILTVGYRWIAFASRFSFAMPSTDITWLCCVGMSH